MDGSLLAGRRRRRSPACRPRTTPVRRVAEEVDSSSKMRGSGFHDADVAGVHDTLDLHSDAWTHLTELELRQALGHHSVGVGDDPESDPGVGQGLETLPAAGYGFDQSAASANSLSIWTWASSRHSGGTPHSGNVRSAGSRAMLRTSSPRRPNGSRIALRLDSGHQPTPLG